MADSEEEPVFDLGAIWARVKAMRWWIVAAVVVSSVAFGVAAFVIPPVYRAWVVLAPASAERSSMGGAVNSVLGQMGPLGGVASLAGINVGGADVATEEALAVLRSRQFTGAFIQDKNLKVVLFPRRWDPVANSWKGGPDAEPSAAAAYRYFNKRVRSIVQDKKTGLVTLQVNWVDREEAAAWANELVQRLNSEIRARAIANADKSLSFLERELASTQVIEVRDAINRLIESQVKRRMLADVTEEYAFRVVDRATIPDEDETVMPSRVLLLAIGPLVGLIVGTLLVLLTGVIARVRE